MIHRRSFLATAAGTGACAMFGDLGFLRNLPAVSAAEARLEPDMVRFHPDIEPLVRLLEDTPRERCWRKWRPRVRRGLSYREVLAALLLAGVRNVQPRPVGFKFHAVLVVNSAHLASLASPDTRPLAADLLGDRSVQDLAGGECEARRLDDGSGGRSRRPPEPPRATDVHRGDGQLGRSRRGCRRRGSRAHGGCGRALRDFRPLRRARLSRHRAQGDLRREQLPHA